jgi:hypothetical protein
MGDKEIQEFQNKLAGLKWNTNEDIQSNIEWMLSLRSDDFGHDCTDLLNAESQCLQVLGEQFLEYIK